MSCEFTEEELNQHAKEMARFYWERDLDIPIILSNGKWKNRLAAYCIEADGTRYIKMSSWRNKQFSNEIVLDTLKHELVHWHLETTGQPYYDDTKVFVQECIRVNAPISGTKIAKQVYREVLIFSLLDEYRIFIKKEDRES